MPGKIRGLLHWSRKVTDGYEGIEIKDMTSSWKNGLVFCAIINRFRPDLIDFYSLSADNVYHNNNLAFTIAEKEFGIARLLDPKDMVEMEAPDRYSIATYVSSFYETFNNQPMYDPPDPPVVESNSDNPSVNVNNTTDVKNGTKTTPQEQSVKSIDNHTPVLTKNTKSEDKTLDNQSLQSSVINTYDNATKSNDSEQKRIIFEKKNGSDSSKSHSSKSSDSNDSSESSDDDISDLYDRNKDILYSSSENHEEVDCNNTASSLNKSFSDICKSEIEELQNTKPNAVLEAALSAGMTVVAVSAVSDDKDLTAKLDQNPVCQNICQQMIQDEENNRPDLSDESEKDCDKNNVLDVSINNTDSNEQKTLKDLKLTSSDSSSSESESSVSSNKDAETEETVKTLNIELNKGKLEIVNVDLVEESDQSDSKLENRTLSVESEEHVNEKSAADKIASEIVENVFKEVSKNPELFQEIPSIVKEVESGLNLQNEEDDTSSQSSEAEDITASNNEDKTGEENILSDEQESNIKKIHNDNIATCSAESFYSVEDQLSTKDSDDINIKVDNTVLQQTETITMGDVVNMDSSIGIENDIKIDNASTLTQEEPVNEDLQTLSRPSEENVTKYQSSSSSDSEGESDNETDVSKQRQILINNDDKPIETTQNPKLSVSTDSEDEQSNVGFSTSDSGIGTLIVEKSRDSTSSSSSSSDSESDKSKNDDENKLTVNQENSSSTSVLSKSNDEQNVIQDLSEQQPDQPQDLTSNEDSTRSSDTDIRFDSDVVNVDLSYIENDRASNPDPNDDTNNNQVSSTTETILCENIESPLKISPVEVETSMAEELPVSRNTPDTGASSENDKHTSESSSSDSESIDKETQNCIKEPLEVMGDALKETEVTETVKNNESSSSSSSSSESDSEDKNEKEILANYVETNIQEYPTNERSLDIVNKEVRQNIENANENISDQDCKHISSSSNSDTESKHQKQEASDTLDVVVTSPSKSTDSSNTECKSDEKIQENVDANDSENRRRKSSSSSSDSEPDQEKQNIESTVEDNIEEQSIQFSASQDIFQTSAEVEIPTVQVMPASQIQEIPLLSTTSEIISKKRPLPDNSEEDEQSSKSSSSSESDNEDGHKKQEIPVKSEENIEIDVKSSASSSDAESEKSYPILTPKTIENRELNTTTKEPNCNQSTNQVEKQPSSKSSSSSESDEEEKEKEPDVKHGEDLRKGSIEEPKSSSISSSEDNEPEKFEPRSIKQDELIDQTEKPVEPQIKYITPDLTETKTVDLSCSESDSENDKQKSSNLSSSSPSSNTDSDTDTDLKLINASDLKSHLVISNDPLLRENNQTGKDAMKLPPKVQKNIEEIKSEIDQTAEDQVKDHESDTISSDSDSESETTPDKKESKRKLSTSSSSSSDSDREPPALPSSCPPTLETSETERPVEREYIQGPELRNNSKNAYENVILPNFNANKELLKKTRPNADTEVAISSEVEEPDLISPMIEMPVHSEAKITLQFEPANVELKSGDQDITCTLPVENSNPNLLDIESQIVMIDKTHDDIITDNITRNEKEITQDNVKPIVLPSMSVSKLSSSTDKSFSTDFGEKLMLPGKGILPNTNIAPEISQSEEVLVETPTVKRDASFEFLPDTEKINEPTPPPDLQVKSDDLPSVSEPKPIQKTYADVDTDVLKKAALMSQKMAKQITAKIIDDSQVNDKEAEEETPEKKSDEGNEPAIEQQPQDPQPSTVDEKKAKRLAMFRDLEYSTRPFKKKVEDDSDAVADVTVDFRNKMKMWNRKSSCNDEPDYNRLERKETVPRKRLSLTSPFLTTSLPSSPSPTEQTHMKKLQECLPKEPQPGSVAHYIRKLSVSSSPTEEDTPIESKEEPKNEVQMRPKTGIVVDKSDIKKRYSDITPSVIFSSRQMPRGRPSFQNRKLNVKPMSVELKDVVDSDPRVVTKERPKSISSQKKISARMTINIQPIEKKIETDNGKSSTDDTEVMKRPPISRGQSPRRALSLTSPTRPDINVRKSEERDRNIWTDMSSKPPSPNLKRRDSLEVKVRPVSKQLSKEEKDGIKKEKELERQGSFKSTRPPTPTKTLPKVEVSVRPVSAQPDLDVKSKPIKKRNSILSVVKKNVKPKSDETKSEAKKYLPDSDHVIKDEITETIETIQPVAVNTVESKPVKEPVITPNQTLETKHEIVPANKEEKEEKTDRSNSSYKKEKDKEMKKCNSIFSKTVKTIDQGVTKSNQEYDKKEKERTISSSSSSSSTSSVSSKDTNNSSKETLQLQKDNTDRTSLEDDKNVSRPDKERKSPSSSSSESADEKSKADSLADNSQKSPKKHETEGNTLQLPKQKSRSSSSSSSDDQSKYGDKPQHSTSLSPSSLNTDRKVSSSSSAAEIEKAELKEELQDIVKELEQDMEEKDDNKVNNEEISNTSGSSSSDSESSGKKSKKAKIKKKKKKKKKQQTEDISSSESEHRESDSDDDKDKSVRKPSSSTESEGKPSSPQQQNDEKGQETRKTSQDSNQSNESVDSITLAEPSVINIPSKEKDTLILPEEKIVQEISSSSSSSESSDSDSKDFDDIEVHAKLLIGLENIPTNKLDLKEDETNSCRIVQMQELSSIDTKCKDEELVSDNSSRHSSVSESSSSSDSSKSTSKIFNKEEIPMYSENKGEIAIKKIEEFLDTHPIVVKFHLDEKDLPCEDNVTNDEYLPGVDQPQQPGSSNSESESDICDKEDNVFIPENVQPEMNDPSPKSSSTSSSSCSESDKEAGPHVNQEVHAVPVTSEIALLEPLVIETANLNLENEQSQISSELPNHENEKFGGTPSIVHKHIAGKEKSDHKSSSSSSSSSSSDSESDSECGKKINKESTKVELIPEKRKVSLENIIPQFIQSIPKEKIDSDKSVNSIHSSSSPESDSESVDVSKVPDTEKIIEYPNFEMAPKKGIPKEDNVQEVILTSPNIISKPVHEYKEEHSKMSSSSSSSSDSDPESRTHPQEEKNSIPLKSKTVYDIDTISGEDKTPDIIQIPMKEDTDSDHKSHSKRSSSSSSSNSDSELEDLQKAYENVQTLDASPDDSLVQNIETPSVMDLDANLTPGDEMDPCVTATPELDKSDEEDSLLQSVIEDSLPFKAPILENMIKTASMEDSSHDSSSSTDEEKSKKKRRSSSSNDSTDSDSDSSDDLYSDSKSETKVVEYILPECNIITTDFDYIDPKKGINFASIEPLSDPIDIQVFMIPDRPVDRAFSPKYQEPVLVLPEIDILKSDYPIEDLIIPSPPMIVEGEPTDNHDKNKDDRIDEKINKDASESEDELLKNIMLENQMNIRNKSKREDSPYTSDEDDEHRKDKDKKDDSKNKSNSSSSSSSSSSEEYSDHEKKKSNTLGKVKAKLKKLKDKVFNKKDEESSSSSDSESDEKEKPVVRQSRRKTKTSISSENDENKKPIIKISKKKRKSESSSSDRENDREIPGVVKQKKCKATDPKVKDIFTKQEKKDSSSSDSENDKEKPVVKKTIEVTTKIKTPDDANKLKKPKVDFKVSSESKDTKSNKFCVSSASESSDTERLVVKKTEDCDKKTSTNIKLPNVDFKIRNEKERKEKTRNSSSTSDSSDDENIRDLKNNKSENENKDKPKSTEKYDKPDSDKQTTLKEKIVKKSSSSSSCSSSSSSSDSSDSESENKDIENVKVSSEPIDKDTEKVKDISEPAGKDENQLYDNSKEAKQAITPEDFDEYITPVIRKEVTAELQAAKKPDNKNAEGNIVDTKFMIGREKDPSKSEVARLIQQSLELDRRREEQRRLEQERLRELQDQLKPRDEVLEHEHQRHVSETVSEHETENEQDQEESSIEDEVEEQEMSEELLAGEATPMSMPSGVDTDNSVSSPEEGGKPVVEVFDLQESSGEDISPDMESQALFVKLKEAQCKNAVLEAELTKLKARLIVLENADSQQKQAEKKCEEMAARLRETERSLTNARKEINHYQSSSDEDSSDDQDVQDSDMMEGSQGQYIALEKKMKGEFTALEKKYHKAKKLIKEYQQREKDFIAERESFLQQQTEKDQQYNALVKSLKDRIFQLEGELRSIQTAAGIPLSTPGQEPSPRTETVIAATSAPTVHAIAPMAPIHDSGSPVMSPVDKESMSSESDISSAEPISPVHEGEIRLETSGKFESVPAEGLLDTSIHRAKAQAANAARRPPSKLRPKSTDSVELMEGVVEGKQDESGLETWIKHDSDNTVKKSDVKKRKAQLQSTEIPQATPSVSETTPPVPETPPTISKAPPTEEKLPPPPPPPSHPPPSLPDSETSETSRERKDSDSEETSSTVSQTSYDPSKPNFRGMDSEIPTLDTNSTDTTGTNDTAESGTDHANITKKSKGLLPKLPFKFGAGGGEKDKGGVMLLSSRSLNKEDAGSIEGGITLVSRKKLDTGLDFDGASTISDTSSGYMVGEVESSSYNFSGTPANEDHPSLPGHHAHNQFQSCPITEWNQENIHHWLMAIEMEKYAPLFSDKSITGPQLVAMDSNKLKAIGISNSKDRDILKKKIKELKVVLEKERKQQEKERKQQEKEQKAREKEQKKMFKKK